MLRQYLITAKIISAVLLAAALSGCASSYPDISNIQRVAQDALSPDELKKTINDLTLEQKKHNQTGSKTN